jgi:FtsZ-interacting cell division protein ZipA
LLLVAAIIWAIIATVMASKSRKECERISAERDQIRLEADQTRTEAQRAMADAEKLRKVAYEEMRKNQLRIQEELRKKAADAAKAAQAKAAPAKAPAAKTVKKAVRTSNTRTRR